MWLLYLTVELTSIIKNFYVCLLLLICCVKYYKFNSWFVWIFRGSLHPLSTSPLLFLFTFVYGYLRKPISINALVSDLSIVKNGCSL